MVLSTLSKGCLGSRGNNSPTVITSSITGFLFLLPSFLESLCPLPYSYLLASPWNKLPALKSLLQVLIWGQKYAKLFWTLIFSWVKDPNSGKDWRQEEKGMTEDEMVGWHYQLEGHEFEQAPGNGDGQGGLVCCSPWGHKELDTTEKLNWSTETYVHTYTLLYTCMYTHYYVKLNIYLSPVYLSCTL